MADKNSIVLSYGDALLRESDVELLRGPNWLNDNIISFYFEFLKNEFKNNPQLLFIPPEVTQCLKITSVAQIGVFLEPLLNATDRNKYLFLPLNDNESVSVAGGTHWSLLIISLINLKSYHYDSANKFNADQAYLLSSKLFKYFECKGELIEERALQQDNGYDCGIHVLCTAKYLAKHLSNNLNKSIEEFNPRSEEIQMEIPKMRTKLIEIIMKLKPD